MSQRLPRAERVRRRREFERIYETGVRIHGRLMTVFVASTASTRPRVGVAATRKLGSAVERNRAKRLARELFRRNKLAAGLDIVIVPRREMLDAPFGTIEADYLAALERRDRQRPRRERPRTRGGRPPRPASRI